VKRFVELWLVWARMGAIATPYVTLPRLSQEDARIAVVSDNVTEGVSDLSIPELLRQIEAQEHGTIEVARGFVLFRGSRADDAVGHVVSFGMP